MAKKLKKTKKGVGTYHSISINGTNNRSNTTLISGVPEGNKAAFGVTNIICGTSSTIGASAAKKVFFDKINSDTLTDDPKEYMDSKVKMYTMLNNAFLPFYIAGCDLHVPIGTPVEFCVDLVKQGVFPIDQLGFYSYGIESGIRDWVNRYGNLVKVDDMVNHVMSKKIENRGFDNDNIRKVIQATHYFYDLIKDDVEDAISIEKEKNLNAIMISESNLHLSEQESILEEEIVKSAGKKAIRTIDEYIRRTKIDVLINVVGRLKYDNEKADMDFLEKEMIEKVALFAAEHDLAK